MRLPRVTSRSILRGKFSGGTAGDQADEATKSVICFNPIGRFALPGEVGTTFT
jgi:hypothetical protein